MLPIVPILFLHPALTTKPAVQRLPSAHETIQELFPGAKSKLNSFISELEIYGRTSDSLSPQASAEKWVGLLKKGKPIFTQSESELANSCFAYCFKVVPRPESWSYIVRLISQEPVSCETLLERIAFARAVGDDRAVLSLTDKLLALLKKVDPKQKGQLRTTQVKLIQLEADIREKRSAEILNAIATEDLSEGNPLSFGVLNSCLTKDQLRTALLRRLKAGPPEFGFYEFKPLLQKLAIENIGSIKTPPWDLVQDESDLPFVRKLVAHYGSKSLDQSFSWSGIWYLLTLLIDGDVEKAKAYFSARAKYDSKYRTWSVGDRDFNGDGAVVGMVSLPEHQLNAAYRTISEVRRQMPTRLIWQRYVELSIRCGHAADAIPELRAVLENQNLPAADIGFYANLLRTAYAGVGDLNLFYSFHAPNEPSSGSQNQLREALSLAEAMGDRTELDKLTAEGARENLVETAPWLIDQGRLHAAEQVALVNLRRNMDPTETAQAALCAVYAAVGRPKDVLGVFSDLPVWSDDDLCDLVNRDPDGVFEDPKLKPLGWYAAWAFARTGRGEVAAEILKVSLTNSPNWDDGYRLLNSLNLPDTGAFYEGLGRSNRDSVRPLIWKADFEAKVGMPKLALRDIQTALATKKLDQVLQARESTEVFDAIAAVYQANGDQRQVSQFQKLKAAAENYQHATTLSTAGFFPQAGELYKKSLSLYPAGLDARIGYADFLFKTDRYDQAVKECVEAVTTDPDLLSNLAEDLPYRNQGFEIPKVNAAGMALLRHIQGSGRKAASLFNARATFERASGNLEAAIMDLVRAVRADPTFDSAISNLASLGGLSRLSPEEISKLALATPARGDWRGSSLGLLMTGMSDLRPLYDRARKVGNSLAKHDILRPVLPLRKSNVGGSSSMEGSLDAPLNVFPGAVLGEDPTMNQIVQMTGESAR